MNVRTILALALLCLPATAATQWLRIRSTNFELLTTAGERKGREAVLYFEAVRRFFEESKIIHHLPATPVRIVAFRSQKEYKPYAAKEFATAYYQPGFQHDYIVMSGIETEDYPAAIHEFTHLLIRHSGLKVPLWLNEGLADMYSTLQPRGKKLMVGAPIPGHLQTLRQTRLAPLETITTADEKSPYYNESSRANIFYAESWALVHMLDWSPQYRPKFDAFMVALLRERDAASALQTVYGKSMAQVQKELYAYINSDSFVAGTVDLRLETKSEDPDVDTMPAWDAQFALAEIMSSSIEKAATGHMMLEQLAHEDPKRWEPEAALGDLDLRQSDRGKALPHFERAVQLGATSPEMYFRYGLMLRDAGKHDKSAEMLRQAVELKPDYEEAHFFLAFEYMDRSNYAKAAAEFSLVKHVTRENAFAFFSSLAYADYRLNRKAEARAEIEHAKQYAKDSVERDQVNQMAAALADQPEPSATSTMVREENATEVDAADSGPKRLQRRGPDDGAGQNVPVPQEKAPELPVAEGQFVELACEGSTARLGLSLAGKVTWYLMDDPRAIVINNAGGASVDLTCGKQKPRKVKIHFVASSEAGSRTAGLIRAIDFE